MCGTSLLYAMSCAAWLCWAMCTAVPRQLLFCRALMESVLRSGLQNAAGGEHVSTQDGHNMFNKSSFWYHAGLILRAWTVLSSSWSRLGTPRVQAFIPRCLLSRIWTANGAPMGTHKSLLMPQGNDLSFQKCMLDGSFSGPALRPYFGTPN